MLRFHTFRIPPCAARIEPSTLPPPLKEYSTVSVPSGVSSKTTTFATERCDGGYHAQAGRMDRLRSHEAHAVQLPFLAIAAVLVVVAAVFWTYRNARMPPVSPQAASLRELARLLHRPRLMLGTLAIFLYVGAEVSIGSMMTNYLMQPSVLALSAARANQHVSFYWGGAMIGRFVGAFVLRRARPGYALAACAVVAGLLASASCLSTGVVAAYALIAVGLFNSIMFPTIFALASEGLGEETPNGSAMLCMAIVGGAIMPVVTGAVADARGLAIALFVPVLCYAWVAIYDVLVARGLGEKADAV